MKLVNWVFGKFTYVSRYIVWAVDVFLSVVATLISYLFFYYLLHINVVPGSVWLLLLEATLVSAFWTFVFKTFVGIIRRTTVAELGRVVYAMLLKGVTLYALAFLTNEYVGRFIIATTLADVAFSIILLMGMRMFVVSFYMHVIRGAERGFSNSLIYGISPASMDLAESLMKGNQYSVVGFVSRVKDDSAHRPLGTPIYYIKKAQDLDEIVEKLSVKNLLYTSYNDLHGDEELLNYGLENNISLRIAPVTEAVKSGARVRNVQIEDLLNRSELNVSLSEIREAFDGKTILVTGAAGSIGSELCRQLCRFDFKKLILMDFAETGIYTVEGELRESFPDKPIEPFISDVRNQGRLERAFDQFRPEIVFHAAAYKHVPLMEMFPCEAVADNLGGTRIVADLSVKYGVQTFIMVSTDKAVHPSNVMGASKRLAEMYVQGLGDAIKCGKVQGHTHFVTTRFGNVLDSNGSVVPLFRKQIMDGGPVTVTHPDIIRYFMTIPEACRLVLEAAALGEGSDVFIFDMGEPVKIADLATRMIRLSGLRPGIDIQIEYIGLRPGEKIREELLYNKEETIPTKNKKIFRAKTIELDYEDFKRKADQLIAIANTGDKRATVAQMKAVVTDFVSLNSVYHELDHPTSTSI